MSHFISELYGNRVIDNLTVCSNVGGDPFRMRRKNAFSTFVWQMRMPALCQQSVVPGGLHSQLNPDLRLGIELPRAVVELSWFCLIPHKVSWETCFPRPWLQKGYKWVSYTLNTSESKQFLEVLKLLSLQFLRCLEHGRHAKKRTLQTDRLRGSHLTVR